MASSPRLGAAYLLLHITLNAQGPGLGGTFSQVRKDGERASWLSVMESRSPLLWALSVALTGCPLFPESRQPRL